MKEKAAPMKATVGRVVHFYAEPACAEARGPYAGLIVAVHPAGEADLVTFGAGSVYFQFGVREARPGSAAARGRAYWCWPPRL